MASIWTGTFWRATGERILSTALQAAIPTITAASLQAIDWGAAASISGAAALLSLAKAMIAGLQNGSPGLGTAEVLAEPGSAYHPPDDDLSNLDRMDGVGRHSADLPPRSPDFDT